MGLLAWILDWQPSRGPVALFLILTAVSAGTQVVFQDLAAEDPDENVTVKATDLTVGLNEVIELPDGGNGSVQTCVGIGTPGNTISIIGTVTLEIPRASGPLGIRRAGTRSRRESRPY